MESDKWQLYGKIKLSYLNNTYRKVYKTLLRKHVFPKLERVAIGVFLDTTDGVDPY